MPKPINLHQRETVALHASWWSEERDESGAYKERAVINAVMTEKDAQWIQANIMASLKIDAKSRGATTMNMAGSELQRVLTMMRMVVDLTDETGASVLPRNADFKTLREFYEAFADRDLAFIADEISKLNEQPVTPTEADASEAAANLARGFTSPERADPQGVAERHFRKAR